MDINKQGATGVTPLYWAYFAGNRKAFELLLEAGADPDKRSNDQFKFKKKWLEELRPLDSLLFTLVRHDRYDYFFLTIPYSADVRQSDYHAESLLHAAIRSRNIDKETMSKLIDAGVDINACDQQARMPFNPPWSLPIQPKSSSGV